MSKKVLMWGEAILLSLPLLFFILLKVDTFIAGEASSYLGGEETFGQECAFLSSWPRYIIYWVISLIIYLFSFFMAFKMYFSGRRGLFYLFCFLPIVVDIAFLKAVDYFSIMFCLG